MKLKLALRERERERETLSVKRENYEAHIKKD